MAWEISIGHESWQTIWKALQFQAREDRQQLVEALAMDDFARGEQELEDRFKWAARVRKYRALGDEELANAVYERVREHRTCSNGGHEIFLDREGYRTLSWVEIESMAAGAVA